MSPVGQYNKAPLLSDGRTGRETEKCRLIVEGPGDKPADVDEVSEMAI